jgi:hypothetical protein
MADEVHIMHVLSRLQMIIRVLSLPASVALHVLANSVGA